MALIYQKCKEMLHSAEGLAEAACAVRASISSSVRHCKQEYKATIRRTEGFMTMRPHVLFSQIYSSVWHCNKETLHGGEGLWG